MDPLSFTGIRLGSLDNDRVAAVFHRAIMLAFEHSAFHCHHVFEALDSLQLVFLTGAGEH